MIRRPGQCYRRDSPRELSFAAACSVVPEEANHGSGASGAQVAALAQDVLDFADVWPYVAFFLVGHDWGSRAAHGVAALAPERVIGLVALATGYGSGTPSER